MKLQTYEGQAKLSVGLGATAGVCALFGVVLIIRNFDAGNFWVAYANPYYLAATLGALGLAVLVGAVGFFLGLHSAEQRRNSASRLSWTGFYLNALTITVSLSLVVFFWLTRQVKI